MVYTIDYRNKKGCFVSQDVKGFEGALDQFFASGSKDLLHLKSEYIRGYTFKDVDISNFLFEKCKFLDCTFDSMEVHSTIFEKCDFHKVTFKGGSYKHINFEECYIQYTRVADLTLDGTMFDGCRFNEFILSDCVFKSKHVLM